METLWQDVRYAFRTIRRNPGFAAVAVLSLALGVGANTTIFTLLNAALLAPLPVERPSELVAIYTSDQANIGGLGNLNPMSFPNLKDMRERNELLSQMAGYSFPTPVSVITATAPQQAFVELVTGNYFSVLGVKAAKGRVFNAEEDTKRGGAPLAVVSYGFWQRRLGGDPSAVGRVMPLNGVGYTIVGVTPEGFRGINSLISPDMWVPSMMAAQVLPSQMRSWIDERRALMFFVAGRLKPGVTIRQAEANLKSIASALEREYPAPNKGRSVALKPLVEATIFPGIREIFVLGGAVLMTVVGLVLLIACSNVANLLMARASARSQEIAVRIAMGAGRARLFRQLLTESLVLAALGGVLGVGVAVAARDGIWSLRPPFLADNFVDLTIDTRVLVFTAFVSLLTGVLFGAIPALRATRPDLVDALKEETRGGSTGRRRATLGRALVVVQVALSVVALVAAGLFLRSLGRANQIDPGFDAEHVAVVAVNAGQGGYDGERARQFFRTVHDRAGHVPGVQSTAWANAAPLTGSLFKTILKEGENPESTTARVLATAVVTTPGYFQTLGIPLVGGRDFAETDRETSLRVAIVNQTLANRIWPNEDPIGKRFRFFTDRDYREVIGVAKTSKYTTLGEDPQAAVYTPLDQDFSDTMILFVRTAGDPAAVLGTAQHEIRALDSHVPLTNPFTMREILKQSLWPARLAAILLGTVGSLALTLASIGLYGVMAYSVTQRTREIGVRIALGADTSQVLTMVMRQAMTLVAVGLAIGVTGALAFARLVTRLLFGMSAIDPATFMGVCVLLVLVSVVASYVPAWRASRLDPIRALR
jgi:macrolide transport system ATP-binding/permease protein